jgi:DNA-3-methyladenine glycosylase I
MNAKPEPQRCAWTGTVPAMVAYHDEKWGVPVDDDRRLFDSLILESARAGLSWRTILAKRENYRRAFEEFAPERVARFGPADAERLLANPAIVRNRLKVAAAIENARGFLVYSRSSVRSTSVWCFVSGASIDHGIAGPDEMPATTAESDARSKDLLRRALSSSARRSAVPSYRRLAWSTTMKSCFRHAKIR